MSADSSFSFEMKVLKKFNDLGFHCQHSGTYTDPISSKIREFDIRAVKEVYKDCLLHLAIECKNLKKNFPLIISSTPRKEQESFHDLIVTPSPIDLETKCGHQFYLPPNLQDQTPQRIGLTRYSPYEKGKFVGKSMDQIGYNNNGELKSSESSIFEKMSQAINSSFSLIEDAYSTARYNKKDVFHCVIPILVVPDGTLWEIRYNEDGTSNSSPLQQSHIPYYIDRNWRLDENSMLRTFTSHLEIITDSGIDNFIKTHFSKKRTPRNFFGPSNNYLSTCLLEF